MVDLQKSPRALDSDVITNNVQSAADSRYHLFDAKLLPWQIAFAQEYPEGGVKKVNTTFDMLDAHRQMIHTCAEEMKDISRQLQCATAMQTREEVEHAPQYVDMNTYHLANDFGAAPAQQQLWGLPNNAQTSPVGEASINAYCHLREVARMPIQQSWCSKAVPSTAQTSLIDRADTEQYSHQQMASHHENRMSLRTFSHECATLLQAVTPSGRWDLPQQPRSSTTFTHAATGEESQMRVSTMASPRSEGGIRDYLCDCGLEIKRKGDLDRHRQSLRHSERMYACSCGKTYTRPDSLKRHRKVCKKKHHYESMVR